MNEIIKSVADAIISTMFAEHEIPIPDELYQKYLITAKVAIDVATPQIARIVEERRKLFDLISSWKSPLFDTRMQVMRIQGEIDSQIYEVRRAWYNEHGYHE